MAALALGLEAACEPAPGYRLVRLVGQGGSGVVWEAEAPGGIRVALKFVKTDSLSADRELRALEMVCNIRHPHLLDIQFAVRWGGCLVLAMPLCDQSLADRLHTCRKQGLAGLPKDEVMRYMRELAEAIDYLNEPRHPVGNGEGSGHERLAGVQHRDIKPQNIFLVGGSVRLGDFGLAKLMEASLGEHSGCMSPHYVAPEQLHGRVARQTDQYALAVTYYQLRTGRLPFTGSIAEVLNGHLHRDPDLSGLAEGERSIVARAMAKRPETRWPSCREFVNQLTGLSSGVTPDFERRGHGAGALRVSRRSWRIFVRQATSIGRCWALKVGCALVGWASGQWFSDWASTALPWL